MTNKPGRNDKCPCGSNKKYKHCCLNNTDTLSEFDEIAYLKQFTPLTVILWLQTVMCHPNNALYLHRLFFLLGLAISIPAKEFGAREMTYEDVKKLFESIEDSYSKTFFQVEDFDGFDQAKLIPLFLYSKKYYFFYGNFERPHEYFLQLKETYFFIDDSIENEVLYKFQREVIKSLEFQTELLERLKNVDENLVKQEMLYVPTTSYYQVVSAYFLLDEYSMLPAVVYKLGDFSKKTSQDILNKSVEMDLFSMTHIDINGQLIWIAPHIHLNIFINEGRKMFRKDPILMTIAHNNYKLRLNKLCRTFFGDSNEILAILEKGSDVNILKDIVDFATIVDSNKLLLFSGVDYSLDYDISNKLNKKIALLNTLRQKIMKSEVIGVVENGDEFAYGVYTKALEIWLIPVHESICLDVLASLKKEVMHQVFIFGYLDLRPVFDRIEKPFDFLKFIKEDTALQQRTRGPIMGEFINRFYFYVKNGNSHLRSGRSFDHSVFDFHMWSDHIFEENWKKYQDSAYEEIELKHPDFFNRIENYKGGVYRMMNTAEFAASYLIKLSDRFIWCYLPPAGWKLEYREFHVGVDIIAPLICDYMNQFEKHFSEILSSNSIDSDTNYSFVILPKSLVRKMPEFSDFIKDVEALTEDNPIIFRTFKMHYRKVKTIVLFDHTLFPKLFGQSENVGERYTVKFLIKSIIEFHEKDSPNAEKIAENFINVNLPLGIKGYSVEEFSVPNANLDKYTSPVSLNDTDIAITEREISKYLIENNISPGDYIEKEANEINYKVYTFLQSTLENEISKFDKQFIVYAYRQLELAEGDRYMKKIALGMRSKGRADYDIVEATKESENKMSHLTTCIKHIIHTSLKIENSGANFITGEVWTKLTALADAILASASIYDYIQYDLRKHILKITDDYLIKDIPGEEVVDSEKLHLKHTEIKIERAKRAHSKAIKEPSEVNNEFVKPEIFNDLDRAFREDLNFSYDDFVFVLHALSVLPLADKVYFPVSIKSTYDLFTEIDKIDSKGVSEETVGLILNFLCLYSGVYNKSDLLYPSEMMRNKERINISPFIRLEDNLFLYGNEAVRISLNFWSALASGDFPFLNKSYPHIKAVIESIHRKEDLALEQLAEEKAVEVLGRGNVEARISNFKRLSETFKRKEDCGEIDLLCINKETKTLFVIDAKNINKKMSIYYIKQSIKDFFEDKKSYYSKLLRKKDFVKNNMETILSYFGVNDVSDWNVKEVFVSEEVYFAAYYNKIKVDFVLVEDLEAYLNT